MFSDEINVEYARYEEDLKQFMAEYELAVGTEGNTPEEALAGYAAKVQTAYYAHRATIAEKLAETKNNVEEISAQYSEMGKAFYIFKKVKATASGETRIPVQLSGRQHFTMFRKKCT